MATPTTPQVSSNEGGRDHLRAADAALLRAEDLVVEFPVGRSGAKVHAVSGVSLDVLAGETLGLVGESGCGKSTTGRALMQLPRPTSGTVWFEGAELTALDPADLRQMRPDMQMIFQDPISSLNPRRRVGDIVAEPLRIWASVRKPPSTQVRLAQRLGRVDAALRFLGAAVTVLLWLVGAVLPYLANNPDFGVTGPWKWISATGGTLMVNGLVLGTLAYGLSNLVRDRVPRSRAYLAGFAAFNALLLALALTGRGSGLSVVVWALGTLLPVAALVVLASPRARSDYDAMATERADHQERVRKVLEDVGLDPDTAMGRRPHEFSGGQCQRICIARALVLDPKVVICDEPVSALDVSVQAQILNLLQDMKARYHLTLVFIAHDLAVVKNVSDRVAVMYLGRVCEVAGPDTLYDQPAHPYTEALLRSIPVPDPTVRPEDAYTLRGELPSPVNPPSGCRFRTRCPRASERCATVEPQLRPVAPGHYVACHHPLTDDPS